MYKSKEKYEAGIVIGSDKEKRRVFYDLNLAKTWLGSYVLKYPDAVAWEIKDVNNQEFIVDWPKIDEED